MHLDLPNLSHISGQWIYAQSSPYYWNCDSQSVHSVLHHSLIQQEFIEQFAFSYVYSVYLSVLPPGAHQVHLAHKFSSQWLDALPCGVWIVLVSTVLISLAGQSFFNIPGS